MSINHTRRCVKKENEELREKAEPFLWCHCEFGQGMANAMESGALLEQIESIESPKDQDQLPRRSSNRLRKKQVEQKDFSKLPPKYAGLPSPSMRFCDYVINELLNSKYEPINWLIELPTVKKKLNHRQYANAEEFANEIRTLCMNPIDAALTDECLSLLQIFDKLWLYLPPDPEERNSTFMNVLDVEQADAFHPSTYPAEPREGKNAQRLHTDVHASVLRNVKNKQIVVKKTGEKALMAQHHSYADPDDCVPVASPHHAHSEMVRYILFH
ncbi:unnamed protein product [Haemonchus placei]|uniref:Bromo domain-containing protein n=1 Tax=Haemonchus placei TaxID=6290 RepID=A0A0N4W481_HAEPC|nr:unnamed protein product [Haemonchus placei]